MKTVEELQLFLMDGHLDRIAEPTKMRLLEW